VLYSQRLLVLIALLLLGARGAHAEDIFSGIGRIFKDWGLFQGMQVSGQNTMTLQNHALEGSAAAFEGQRWDTDSFVRRSSLHIEGPIWRNLGIQADISASGWGQNYTRYVLGWTTDETALYFGDLNVRLSGNEFASFNKTLKGWQIDQVLPNGGLVRGFYSQEKGLTRRETINGNNTSGPFFLRYTPIIEGSEVIKVDEQVMRFGQDYRLDYETGQLWFEPVDGPPRIIPSTSVISAAYQSYGWESSPGQLYGARAQMPLLNDRMLVGVTALMQDKRDPEHTEDTAGFQEDIFQASGSTGPFDVNFRPILPNGATVIFEGERQTLGQSVVVLVDSVEQVQSVDYDVYHEIGRIIFRRAVPPTALVIVRYFYDLGDTTAPADSQVFGIDLGYRVNDNLTFRADFAQSDQSDRSGQAWRSSLSYSRPSLTATLEMRDVQPDFSYIETVGFQRKEQGLNFAAQWEANDYISIYERYSDLKSDSGLSFGYSGYGGYSGFSDGLYSYGMQPAQATAGTGLEIQTARNDMGIDVRYPGWPTLSLTRQTMDNSGGSRGDSSQTSDMLTLQYAPYDMPFSVNMSLSQTEQSFSGLAADSSVTTSGSSTDQMQISATYTPAANLSLAGHYGTNSSRAAGTGDRSDGIVTQLSARWTPSSRLSFNLDHTRSQSDGAVSSGFYGGIAGIGGGIGGGIGSFGTLQLPGNPGGGGGEIPGGDDDEPQRSRFEDTSTRMDISWRPADNLNLTLSGGQRNYSSGGSVGYLADSEQTYMNASLGYQPSRDLALTATLGSDRMEFLEEGRGSVVNDIMALGVNYRPENQPWGVGLNLHKQSGSSPTYIGFGENQVSRIVPTDLFDISGELNYELRPGVSLFGRIGRADYNSGFAAFVKDTSELGVRYRVSGIGDVNLGYRYIRNISGDIDLPLPGAGTGSFGSQDYIAHTMLLEVSTNFSSGIGSAGRAGGGYSTYGGALSSFGGYGAGYTGGYGYEAGGIGDFGTGGSFRRSDFGGGYYGGGMSTTPFGQSSGTFTNRTPDFFTGADDTRGSSAHYYAPVGGTAGFETGLGEFEQPDQQTVQPPAPFGREEMQGQRPPESLIGRAGRCLREGVRRWWQWYE
jgi:hypothetical protein